MNKQSLARWLKKDRLAYRWWRIKDAYRYYRLLGQFSWPDDWGNYDDQGKPVNATSHHSLTGLGACHPHHHHWHPILSSTRQEMLVPEEGCREWNEGRPRLAETLWVLERCCQCSKERQRVMRGTTT